MEMSESAHMEPQQIEERLKQCNEMEKELERERQQYVMMAMQREQALEQKLEELDQKEKDLEKKMSERDEIPRKPGAELEDQIIREQREIIKMLQHILLTMLKKDTALVKKSVDPVEFKKLKTSIKELETKLEKMYGKAEESNS